MSELRVPERIQSTNGPYRREMAFPLLTEEMVERLKPYGAVEIVATDTRVYSRGDREVNWIVILSGQLEVSTPKGNDTYVLTTLEPLQFSGELDLLSSRQTLVNARTTVESTLLVVRREEFQHLMRSEGDIANLIMQAIIWRRLGILETGSGGIVLLGRSNASDTIALQRFLTRNSYPHQLLEPTPEQTAHAEDPSAAEEHLLPAVLFTDGTILHRPTISQLADRLGLFEELDPEAIYDLVVVGAGPSGLAAAVYGASEGLGTLVVEGIAPGGQAGTSSKIENYLGFPTGVSGQELANRAWVQAQKFGARMAISREVTRIDTEDGLHKLCMAGACMLQARSVVIATGAQYRKLDAENYAKFEGQGIQYAATAMEAVLCKDEEVVVVGGGNSAGQAAVFLSGIAKHVHLIIRGKGLAATMSRYLIARIENSARITLHTCTEVVKLDGDSVLRCATWINRDTSVSETRAIGSMFVMIGAEPNTGWLYGTLALDKKGFVITGGPEAFENSRYATSVPGIYAVGDVRSDSVKRVASAVGEGSVVVSDVHRYLARQTAEAEVEFAAEVK